MVKLIVAAKATAAAYPALVAANFVNNDESGKTVELEFVNESTVDKAAGNVAAKLEDGDVTTTDQVEILNRILVKAELPVNTSDVTHDIAKMAFDKLYVKNFKELAESLEKLDASLNFRTFRVGYSYSLADIAIWGALRANAMMGSILKNEVYINISRWYNFLAEDKKFADAAEIFKQSVADLKKSEKAQSGGKKEAHKANFEIDLPNAEIGKVVTRFPPEPSGYLHIGHAKAAILNEYFAHAYKGKLIIRFDDTNPTKEKVEFQDSILEDLELLGIKGDKITYSSDYFDEMYDLAVKLIKDGKAYCDDTQSEQMRAERMDGIASQRRERSIEENLKIFTEEMKNGTEVGLMNCLRAKIDYSALNKTLRDPVIYRCNLTPHHRTGSAWKMYPIYDFCVPIVDSIEGVTHALRTIEYRDRNAQYDWFLKVLNLRKVHIWDFARVNFVRTLLSKRKLQWFVDKKLVSNWDDPRFPTVRGVRRRGMTVEGLRNFVISQGPSKNIINLDWNVIWAMNKKIIDPVAPRFTAIDKDNAVSVKLIDGPSKSYSEEKPKHKKNPAVGEKSVIYSSDVLLEQQDAAGFSEGEEVTFMDWGNVIIQKIVKENDVIKGIEAKLHLEGDFRSTSKKVTWLADTSDKCEVELVDFDHLITKDKLDEGDNFEDFITPKSEFKGFAYADNNIRKLKAGDIIQFERKGYYRMDKALSDNSAPVFFTIPDGKSVSRYGAKK